MLSSLAVTRKSYFFSHRRHRSTFNASIPIVKRYPHVNSYQVYLSLSGLSSEAIIREMVLLEVNAKGAPVKRTALRISLTIIMMAVSGPVGALLTWVVTGDLRAKDNIEAEEKYDDYVRRAQGYLSRIEKE